MQLIKFRGRLAAMVFPQHTHLARHIDELPDTHPDKLIVQHLCLYVRLQPAGEPRPAWRRTPAQSRPTWTRSIRDQRCR